MGEEDNNGWHTVRGRQRHQRDNNRNHNFDIATVRGFNKENIKLLTTYFFTDFPDNVRAKTCFNAFLSYGDIVEVVIPAKRDKGGRRFRFAWFDRVADPRKLEIDMDNILIGRVKISVNLSRFHRPEGNNSGEDRNVERKGRHVKFYYVHNRPRYSSTNGRQQSHHSRENMKDSYAHAPQGKDGRDSVRVLTEDEEDETEEEEEEEADVRRMLTVADGLERESEGEGKNLLALNSSVNPNNTTLMEVDHAIVTNFLRETGEENSNHSINLDTNLNTGRVISENLNSKRGYVVLEGGEELVDSLIVNDGKLKGREESVCEPTFSVLPKQNVMRCRGSGRRGSTSVDLGQLHNSNNQLGYVSGDAGELRGGVYSDGLRAVYNKLNSGPSMPKTPQKKIERSIRRGNLLIPLFFLQPL
ncbi:unnamed protein product [Trifolium pratense]|uniref:Uncharacterized protein n=1 Tax=Trifolium pratense TaxID=57577 RepID=A0ACB0IZA6_TRIPR|nr:unnamed protein product [Trifolium pratense]